MGCLPKLRKRSKRAAGYSWRICPYSTCDITNRIPVNEKTIHYTTSGYMQMDIRGGHDNVGFVCLDPNCSYFKGTATTQIVMQVPYQTVDPNTGEYTIELKDVPIPVCSGNYFWEK